MAETERDDGAAGFLRCFGAQLRLLRERKGLTRAELGSLLGYGEDQVASVELGRRIPKPEMIDRADEVLGAGGLLVAMKGRWLGRGTRRSSSMRRSWRQRRLSCTLMSRMR